MKTIVLGLGIQGHKRKHFAGADYVAAVDPVKSDADYPHVSDVPLNSYDSALVCLPDAPKYEVIQYLLTHGKHVLVEKPLFLPNRQHFIELQQLAVQKKVVLYTAYNHRFEPHFKRVAEILKENTLGKIYRCHFFYGNGTARLARGSWRDHGGGVITDLAPHLLDLIDYWFLQQDPNYVCIDAQAHENNSPDYAVIMNRSTDIKLTLEMSMLSWRNSFYCDLIAEKGAIRIDSLCKWGPSQLIYRQRVLPSGRPPEIITTLTQDDPTWAAEYQHFKSLVMNRQACDISKELWIYDQLQHLIPTALQMVSPCTI
jgi:scyllo-inositol 2-dehydrogenase (NADP+)